MFFEFFNVQISTISNGNKNLSKPYIKPFLDVALDELNQSTTTRATK